MHGLYTGILLLERGQWKLEKAISTLTAKPSAERTLSPDNIIDLPFLFKAEPTAYGSSQARRPIGAAAASLHHSHRNTRSGPHL